MEENLDEKLAESKQPSYYDVPGRKTSDFLIGFFGGLFINTILGLLIGGFQQISVIVTILTAVFDIGAIVYFAQKRRRFIIFGFAALIGIPLVIGLLFFGTCIILSITK